MNKKVYSLFKETIPNFLLSILLILLFDVFNYKVEVFKSIYVIYFAIWFTLLTGFLNGIVNFIQILKVRKISISDIITNKSNKVIKFLLFFKILKMISTIIAFSIISSLYKETIFINNIFIAILIGFIIEILKIILNIIFRFDKIITLNTDSSPIDEKLDDLIEDILKEEDKNKRINLNEKNKKGAQDFDKLTKRTPDPIEKDEEEE